MVVIDTDVLLLAFAFPQDHRRTHNSSFLDQVQTVQPATTIYNLMELLGQLSFNLSPGKLADWQSWLIDAYQLTVIWPIKPDEPMDAFSFREEIYEQPLTRMQVNRMSFVDTLILNLAERTPGVNQFITWNARHFKNKTFLSVITPEEYLFHTQQEQSD